MSITCTFKHRLDFMLTKRQNIYTKYIQRYR